MMKKVYVSSILTWMAACLWMDMVYAREKHEQLNQIQMTLSAEAWAKTSSARVTVTVDAVLSQAGLATMHNTIMQKLTKISNAAPWHIITFDRQKDKSDLERLYVVAEARLPESALATLRKATESLSKEGEKYRLESVEFTPSLTDLEAARLNVRDQIYASAKSELAKLNALYPDQHYFIHLINFNSIITQPDVAPRAMSMMAGAAKVQSVPAVVVSDKIEITAQVSFAAKTPATPITLKTTP